MGQIKEFVKIAIMNIRHNKGRSILTMLGIIIGISSVIMVLSIGGGVSSEINNELEGLAGGQVEVYVDSTMKNVTVSFGLDDMEYIANNVDHVKGVSPYVGSWGTADGLKQTDLECKAVGGTEAIQYMSKEKMLYGHYFTKDDVESGRAVCVIDESSAKLLFGTTDVVGLDIDLTLWGITKTVKVVGVREASSATLINMLDGGGYVTMECPYTFLGSNYYFYMDNFSYFYIFGESSDYCTEIAKKTKSLLEARHDCIGENQIQIQSFTDYSDQYSQIMNIITLFVSLVAAISLIVGGIGVMNIMLVSVTERTREIGIRKSLGARTNSIMIQFLAEAGIMTLIGGIIGIVLGIGGAVIVCNIMGIKAGISAGVVLATTLFSCGVGVFFGIYPAKRAAALRPIDALRHE